MKKEDKKAEQFLGEHTLNIVIAVLCIIVLLYVSVKLYGIFAPQNNNLELSIESETTVNTFEGEHTINLINISENQANILILSKAIYVELRIGESKQIDLDGDLTPDAEITLISVDYEKKLASVKWINLKKENSQNRSAYMKNNSSYVKDGYVVGAIYVTMAWATYSTAESNVGGPGCYTTLYSPIVKTSPAGGFGGGPLSGQGIIFHDYGPGQRSKTSEYIEPREAVRKAIEILKENNLTLRCISLNMLTDEEKAVVAEENAKIYCPKNYVTMAWATYSTAEGNVAEPGCYTMKNNFVGPVELDYGAFNSGPLAGTRFFDYTQNKCAEPREVMNFAVEIMKENNIDLDCLPGYYQSL